MPDCGHFAPWEAPDAVTAAMEAFPFTNQETAETFMIHRLLINPNAQYETGERVGGRLPGYIDNPSGPAMLEAIYGTSA